jgi:hypothetical protein
MVRSIEGVFRNGKVELLEPAPAIAETRVIVTFLPAAPTVDLASRGINAEQASDLRARLKAFEADWQRPEMDAYDEL